MPDRYAAFLSSPGQFGTSRDLGSSLHLDPKVWAGEEGTRWLFQKKRVKEKNLDSVT